MAGFGKAHVYRDNKEFDNVSTSLPKPLAAKLKAMAKAANMPVSKMIMFAVANELDQNEPFKFVVPWPQEAYVQDAHVEEARKVLKFLDHFEFGVAPDTLIMFHDEMGLPDRESVMRGLREAVEKGLVVEFYNHKAKFRHYPKDYFHYRKPTADDKRKLQRRMDNDRLVEEYDEMHKDIL